MSNFESEETIHRRADGIVRSGFAAQGGDSARLARHSPGDAALRRVNGIRQARTVPNGNSPDETERVRGRSGNRRDTPASHNLSQAAAADRSERVRQDTEPHSRAVRHRERTVARTVSQLGREKTRATGSQRSQSAGAETSVPVSDS